MASELTSFLALVSVTGPTVFVTASEAAVMAPVWVTMPAAVRVTGLPEMPAMSKPFESV